MIKTKYSKIIGIAIFPFLLCSSIFAKTDVLFSPRGLIQNSIIGHINSSQDSIDIAVFVFSSGEIAEALFKAKERGVKIRIVLDSKQQKRENAILGFLNEENFDLKFLKGAIGGFMHNTFAVFDANIIVTGSYTLTEHSEKFNYENVIFTNEPEVVEKFQKEFESLYQKGIGKNKTPREETSVNSDTESELKNTHDENVTSTKNDTSGENNNPKDISVNPSIESRNDFLNISFEMFNDLFGNNSRLEKTEKMNLWNNKYKGKYVKWQGKIRYKGITLYDWNKVGISHKEGDDNDADVQLKFDWTKKELVKSLKEGKSVTYVGKLDALKGLSSPYKLVDGDILNQD